MHTVEIDENKAELVASQLSNALTKKYPWYADFKNKQFHCIIFRRKVFKVNRSIPSEYKKVTEYGVNLGIPDYQLDFSPNIE